MKTLYTWQRQHNLHAFRSWFLWGSRPFRSLMKTGRPEYHIPSLETASCDARKVFINVHKCIAKMLQVSTVRHLLLNEDHHKFTFWNTGTRGCSELHDRCMDVPKPQNICCCHRPFWTPSLKRFVIPPEPNRVVVDQVTNSNYAPRTQ